MRVEKGSTTFRIPQRHALVAGVLAFLAALAAGGVLGCSKAPRSKEGRGPDAAATPARLQPEDAPATAAHGQEAEEKANEAPTREVTEEAEPFVLSADAKAQILRDVESILPEGWSITGTTENSTPDDWLASGGGGFLVEGRKNDHTFHIWFLPKDWIGIRKPDRSRRRLTYWEGILVGREYKTITESHDVAVQKAVRKLKMSTPSLVNSGWRNAEEIFKGRFEKADRKARSLMERFCKDEASRNEAAHSLIVLGVPAKGVFLEGAINGKGRAREFCVSALGYFGGKDAVEVLCRALLDPGSSDGCKKYAAMCLERLADPEAGPTLLKALRGKLWVEAATHTAGALERIRYAQAAPMILERMEREDNPHYKTEYAKALASLRYEQAITAIEKLCKVKRFTAEWAVKTWGNTYLGWSAEVALLRMTGQWGQPCDGVRLLLLPPGKVEKGQPVKVALLVENVGDEDLIVIGYLSGKMVVNGQPHQVGPMAWNGMAGLRVNEVWVYPYDLSKMIPGPGKCQIRYEVGKAESNSITLDIPP